MKGIWITKHGGPGVLQVRETPDPSPKAGEVRVRAKACGLNFAEVTARQGLYPDAPKPPCIVGYEGAGVIDAVGDGVPASRVGERVLYLSRFGGHADTVCVPAAQALVMPASMSFEDGAAIPVTYLTAYHMLFRIRRIRPGESILVHMAAGGVGTAVLQLCKLVDGIVTYGTASASKHDFLRAQGCTHPIDYRTLDYVAEVKRLTNGKGVDLVLDPLGGGDWKKGYELLRPAGMLIAFGMANVNTGGTRNLLHVLSTLWKVPKYTPMAIMDTNRSIAGVNVGHLWDELDMLTDEMRELLVLYEKGVIKPHVGKTFPFSKAADAHAELEFGKNVGKVLLIPDAE
jgi:NADPH:quinone reductase-like Zn-dependent oxidoreductase